MIFGLNFGAADIPDGYRKRFAGRTQTKNLTPSVQGKGYVPGAHSYALLVGVCTERSEIADMLVVANNGNRTLFVVERATAGTPVFGIYAG